MRPNTELHLPFPSSFTHSTTAPPLCGRIPLTLRHRRASVPPVPPLASERVRAGVKETFTLSANRQLAAGFDCKPWPLECHFSPTPSAPSASRGPLETLPNSVPA